MSVHGTSVWTGCSWISRGILRDGSFGQHCGLNGQIPESRLLARYRGVLPSGAVPRPEPLSSWAMVDIAGRTVEKPRARRCRRPASLCRSPEYVARCSSPRPASSASEPPRRQYRLRAASVKTEASLLCSLDYSLRRTDLGLANGTGRFDVSNDAEFDVDEIIVGVSEEWRSLTGCGPLGCGNCSGE